jgi:hypothetical protein
MAGLSQTWTVSFLDPATSPVALVRPVNGAALPASTVSAGGRGDAAAIPVTPAAVVAMATAVAPVAAASSLNLDMVLLVSDGERTR